MPQSLEQSYKALKGEFASGAARPPGIFKAYDIRGLYGEEMDGDTAYLVGRAFARVLAGLRGKQTGDLRVGLGRDMRIEAPEMSRRRPRRADRRRAARCWTRAWSPPRCSTTWSARASSTAARWSPRRTTRRPTRASSWSARGRWRSPAMPGSAMSAPTIEAGLPEPPGGGTVEAVDVYDDFHHRVLAFIEPDRGPAAARRRRRGQRDGRADGGPAARAPRPRPGDHLLGPRRRVPRPRARIPCCPRTAGSSSTRCSRRGADLGIAWDGDADRCFFIDDRGEFVRRRLPDRAAGASSSSARSRARRSSTTCGPAARSRTRCASSAGPRT